jgi:U-box domain
MRTCSPLQRTWSARYRESLNICAAAVAVAALPCLGPSRNICGTATHAAVKAPLPTAARPTLTLLLCLPYLNLPYRRRLGLLSDPVATAVGQVYERTSIERHLLHCSLAGQPATDPITNAPLPSLSLLPVFPMRSRAAEFRAAAVRGCIAAAAAPRCLTPVAYLRRAAELLGSGGGVSGACGGHGAAAAAATGRPPASVQESLMTKLKTPTPPTVQQQQQQQQQQQGAPDALSREFVSFLVAHPEPESDALILKYFGFELLRSGQAEAAANVFAGLLIGAGGRRTEQAEYLHLCLDAWAAAAAGGGGGAAVGANIDSSAHHSSVSNNSDGNNTDGDYRPGSGHNVTLGQQQQQQQQSNNNSHHYHTATTTTTTALARRLADLTRGPGALLPSSLLEMLLSESPAAAAAAVAPAGDALASELCAELLSRGAAAAAATASAADEAALGGLPGGLGGALALLLELQRLKERTAARALDNLRGQVEELCSAAAAVGLLLGGSSSTARCSGGGGRAAAAAAGSSSSSISASSNTAIGAAAAAGQEHSLAAGVDGGPEAATAAARSQGSGEYGAKSCCGEVSGGGGADTSALPVATQRRRQRLWGACSGWRRKKGAAFALGHAARLAAAGGLAVASLLDGNGVLLRAARLAPLLYLLRSGL